MAELTPMMKQYAEIKQQNPDCILFFRLGDFYEMFNEDAQLASRELDLTLTTRDRNRPEDERVPMCGVPYHASESYIARLVARGYKVAICEQMEDPALAKGLVKRDIIRIVTPGTVTESSMLDESRNNYFACLFREGDSWGLCACDVSTGVFYATQAAGAGAEDRVINELGRFSPSEVLLSREAAATPAVMTVLDEKLGCCHETGADALFDREAAWQTVCRQFGEEQMEHLGLEACPAVTQAAAALLNTLAETWKADPRHIRQMTFYSSGRFMELDLSARRNLELTETSRGREKRGSLLWVLDKTRTSMGGRMLRSWLEKPLLSPAQINRRLAAVQELTENHVEREELRRLLREVSDLERVMARIVTGTANGRDLLMLATGAAPLPELQSRLQAFSAAMLQRLAAEIDPLTDLREEILRAIVDEPPFSVREGGLIRAGYNAELDRLRDIRDGGRDAIAAIEAQEKERTGIRTLKVRYNKVFGYYIEVSKSFVDQVPDTYIRKQTLTNAERYITQELKELENTVLTAKDSITALEYDEFTALRRQIAEQSPRVQMTANAVAELDVLCSLADVAADRGWCRPEIDLSGEIQISEGRHPVVEQVLTDTLFVPNDTLLGQENNRVAIITGPNMAGKSTYMRQVALIVILAQIGSFVPARSARIGIVDRVFTRIGASDDLAAGQSTFMVEMNEVAEILKHATPHSLLILDEIGRGTSTFDGMAIARAVLEYVADRKKLGARTLFSTHYHELTAMAAELPGVKNYNVAVKKRGDDIVFLRRVVPGAADRSFGIEVAKLAGLPESVLRRARACLKELEAGSAQQPAPRRAEDDGDGQISIADPAAAQIRERLEAISVETLTPIEAMNILYELKQLL